MLDWKEATSPRRESTSVLAVLDAPLQRGPRTAVATRVPNADETVARYEELSGRRFAHRDFYEVLAATRVCCIVVRPMNLMVQGRMLPPDADLIANNPSTQLLARMLGRAAPGGRPADWAGLR